MRNTFDPSFDSDFLKKIKDKSMKIRFDKIISVNSTN